MLRSPAASRLHPSEWNGGYLRGCFSSSYHRSADGCKVPRKKKKIEQKQEDSGKPGAHLERRDSELSWGEPWSPWKPAPAPAPLPPSHTGGRSFTSAYFTRLNISLIRLQLRCFNMHYYAAPSPPHISSRQINLLMVRRAQSADGAKSKARRGSPCTQRFPVPPALVLSVRPRSNDKRWLWQALKGALWRRPGH